MSLRLLRHLFVPHRSSLFRPQPGWFRLRLLAKHQHWRLDVHAVAHPNNSLSESSSSVLNVPWARSCDLAHILSLQDPSIPLCATRSVRPAWAAHIRAAPPPFLVPSAERSNAEQSSGEARVRAAVLAWSAARRDAPPAAGELRSLGPQGDRRAIAAQLPGAQIELERREVDRGRRHEVWRDSSARVRILTSIACLISLGMKPLQQARFTGTLRVSYGLAGDRAVWSLPWRTSEPGTAPSLRPTYRCRRSAHSWCSSARSPIRRASSSSGASSTSPQAAPAASARRRS
jgi:hypothetical protein